MTSLPKWLLPGEISLCVISDGILQLENLDYEVPLKPGKYIVTSFGNDSLLLMECTSESSQLLSEVSRGICLSEGPFHIQAHILQLSRIPSQSRSEKKNPEPSMHPPEQLQERPGFPQRHNEGKDYNSSHALNPTTGLNKTLACIGNHSNNTRRVFQKLVHSWIENIIKTTKHKGGTKV